MVAVNNKNGVVVNDGSESHHNSNNAAEEQHPKLSKQSSSSWCATKEKSIVISGYSLRAPKSSSVEEFAEALKAGKDLTTCNTRYPDGFSGLPPRQGLIKKQDIERFNPTFFNLSHVHAEAMDPSLRLLLQVSYEALMDAQIDIQSYRGSKTGVYLGHSFSDTLS